MGASALEALLDAAMSEERRIASRLAETAKRTGVMTPIVQTPGASVVGAPGSRSAQLDRSR